MTFKFFPKNPSNFKPARKAKPQVPSPAYEFFGESFLKSAIEKNAENAVQGHVGPVDSLLERVVGHRGRAHRISQHRPLRRPLTRNLEPVRNTFSDNLFSYDEPLGWRKIPDSKNKPARNPEFKIFDPEPGFPGRVSKLGKNPAHP